MVVKCMSAANRSKRQFLKWLAFSYCCVLLYSYDLEAFNAGAELWFFEFKKISLFACNVTCAFSRECSFDLIFVYVWA